jgi:hypothetical protein
MTTIMKPLEILAVDYAAAWRRNLDSLHAMATERSLNGKAHPELYAKLEEHHFRTMSEVDNALVAIREHVDAGYATELAETLRWKGMWEAF